MPARPTPPGGSQNIMAIPDQQSGWALILAGGEGSRLRPLTLRIAGDERPKQFCRILTGETLLEQTLRRSARLVSAERTLIVVVHAHERYYAPLLADVPPSNMVVQPENRGTAPAMLFSLLYLVTVAPTTTVAVLPSDHYVSDDDLFMAHVAAAFEIVRRRPDLVVLLGSIPHAAEPEYGWIEPAEPLPMNLPARRVRRFWEKPSPALAETLLAQGCLWSTFVIVARVAGLLTLIRSALPDLYRAFAGVQPTVGARGEFKAVQALYGQTPSVDFSRQVLATHPARLAVLPLSGVMWDDLGEPRRVMATLARIGMRPMRAGPEEAVSA